MFEMYFFIFYSVLGLKILCDCYVIKKPKPTFRSHLFAVEKSSNVKYKLPYFV